MINGVFNQKYIIKIWLFRNSDLARVSILPYFSKNLFWGIYCLTEDDTSPPKVGSIFFAFSPCQSITLSLW